MDFISNLIKRPISLVLNEPSNTMDKSAANISASLPNTPSVLEHTKDSTKLNLNNNNNNNNHKQSAKMSSSYNGGGHITDYIGLPEEYLDEFKDILPPPPLHLQNSDSVSQSLLDIDDENTRCMSVTPPPPPLPTETQASQIMTPSMKASQTIDELLSHINDNLQQAGLNDEVLAIASPSNKTELSPLANKASLNNSKLLTPSSSSSNVHQTSGKTPSTTTTAAGSAQTTVFENNSSIHKFHIDPDFDEHQQQHQHLDGAKDHLNNSGVNKSSNKFVGLTEFDEAKIPELPGDLNPNIEEQYTFEECFIPTLTAQQGTKVPDEYIVDKTHLLLPTETDAISSENEVYADCNDEKDPLAATFAEPNSLDVTTDLESYQSATNNTFNSNLNNTMENLADITMEAEGQPLHKLNLTQNVAEKVAQQFEAMDEDEPMDIDMNATMEIIQNTSSNIQHVEKVLQHAENILQHIEDKKPLEEMNANENAAGLLEKQTNEENGIKKEEQANYKIEHSKHELSLNKSIELPVNKSKTLSSECIIETIKKEDNPAAQEATKESTVNAHNLTIDGMNTSTSSNTSTKSEKKLNISSNLSTSISSLNSQKNSVPSSPSFPIKTGNNTGFPRSPKSVATRPKDSPFLEKSDYLANYEKSDSQENPVNNLNGTFVESSSAAEAETNNLNGTFVEPQPIIKENDKRRTFNANPAADQLDDAATDLKNKRQTFSVDPEKTASEKRRTFSVKSNETASSTQFPSTASLRRTFHVEDSDQMPPPESSLTDNSKNDMKSRLTFNMPSAELTTPTSTEPTDMNTSFEPMDVDDTMSQSTTMPMPKEEEIEQRSNSPPLPTVQQRSQSPALPTMQQRSQSPPLPTMQQTSQSPALPAMQQRSQSPALPAVHQRSQSPALPTMQQRSQSPALPAMQQRPQSPALPTMQQRSQSPPLPTMQQRSQSPPLPTMQQRSLSPPLPTMQQRSQSPPLPTMQQNNKPKLPPIASAFDTTKIKEEQISPPSFESSTSSSSFVSQPLPTLIQKRPPIRDARARAAEILSAKEQSNIKVKDEKDIFVEKFTPSPIEDIFTAVSATSTTLTNSSGFSEFDQTSSSSSTSIMNNGEQQLTTQQQQQQQQQFDEEFSGNNNIIDFDFDYLLNKGSNNTPVDRSSLLLKFDPLLGVPVPVNQGQQQQLQQLQIPTTNTINPCLSPTIEEDEHNDSNRSFVIETGKKPLRANNSGLDVSAKLLKERSQEVKQQLQLEQQIQQQQQKRQLTQGVNRKNATMSVDVIKDMSLDNDCNKTFENSNSTQSDDKQINYKMDELEKKIKNEVLKTEDIEKKLKDAEQREEALIKRITEKDKTIAKMTGVIEAYEKAIAELIAEKEQLTQHYEKQLAEVKADRDSNYHHLTSLETTFSDLHVKYEKSKEMTCQLKESEEALLAEKRKNLENLHLQEQRYDKMKNHAMQQLEIANKKLESLTREHSIEITKLKALLKKEEIARSSINEQLAQKTKENAELVKICDELISGQGS